MTGNRLTFTLFLAFLFTAAPVISNAQATISSPYSRYGVGSLFTNGSMANMAMGGTSIAYRSPYFLNHHNPASITALDSNSFVFEGGLYSKITTLRTLENTMKDNYASIGYIFMGFPVTRWWKASIGLLPYSSVGYQIKDEHTYEGLGNVRYVYSGDGGINKAFIGSGIRLSRDLSAGFNFSYLFGSLNKQRSAIFPDSAYHYYARITNSALVRSIYLDFGLQYQHKFASGYFFGLGFTFSPMQAVNAKQDFLAITYTHDYSSNLDIIKDTIAYETEKAGKIDLPMGFGAGLAFGRADRWQVAADFQVQNWSQYSYFGSADSLRNNLRLSVGGQFRPSPIDLGKYWQRITYRAGFRYEQSYLDLHNSRLSEFGMSFGLGLPLKKGSTINIAVETGSLGTTQNGLIRENFIRLTVGSALYERWFLKRKYN